MGEVKTKRGFTLVEAAVAIGVMAILAGMVLPLGVKVLEHQREEATRKSLQTAFEAMFGCKDHSVANMRADLGFFRHSSPLFLYPRAIGIDGVAYRTVTLEDLIRRPPETREFGLQRNFAHGHGLGPTEPSQNFAWGWNGPYWHGPVGPRPLATDHIQPLDAWGNPIVLILYDGGTFQFRSAGRSRNLLGGTQINYPSAPANIASFHSTVIMTIKSQNEHTILEGEYFIRYAGIGADGHPNHSPVVHLGPGSLRRHVYALPPGAMDLCVIPTVDGETRGNFSPAAIPFYVLPGQTREIDYTVD